MRAIINTTLDRQSQRQANGSVAGPYLEQGTEIQIERAEYRNGNTLWYILPNQVQVISHCAEIELYSDLSEKDQDQLFICYRQLDHEGHPVVEIEDVPDTLFFANFNARPLRPNFLSPQIFTNIVMQSLERLNDDSRKHVFIYVHGFDWEPGLKIDLHSQFLQSYFNHPENSIAKVLYFSWPSFGWRKNIDDRSVDAGQKFTENGLFEYFRLLSETLHAEGKTLNLIVHSFGHQLLNGMVTPANTQNIPDEIFDHIFLMASDITYLAFQKNGVRLRNSNGKNFEYNFGPLKRLSDHIHVYYNPLDYLLYISTKGYNGNKKIANFDPKPDSQGITADYRTLGNYGSGIFDEPESGLNIEEGIEFYNIQELLTEGDPGDPQYYPFLNVTDERGIMTIENARKTPDSDYSGFKLLRTFWRKELFMTHHQYLFTCKPVVDHVLGILNQENVDEPQTDTDGLVV